MKLSTGGRLSRAAMVVCALLAAGTAGAADKKPADRKEVIKRARSAYYSLQSQGLAEFQCTMAPNWEALLQETRKTDAAGVDRAIQALRQLQFTVSLGITGSAKVTHTTIAAANDQMAEGLNQVYSGMEQMVSGFFDTWSPFMRTSPFPEAEGNYELADQGEQWTLSYKEGTAAVVTTMGKDFAIHELKVNTPEFFSSLQPQFTRSPRGFLLTGYQADYRGKSPSDTTQLKVGIAYQEVNGFQLPKKLDLSGSYGGSPFQMQVTFLGCQATKQ
jgi:hypothetical protein